MVKNNCICYEHADGYPMPESRYSCRGCKNSFDPNLYDAGCRHPDGPSPRDDKSQRRRIARLRKLVKRQHREPVILPVDVETR